MSVTIRDVARACNVSIGTVSRALKNQPGLSDETRAFICDAARRLGYNTERLRTGRIRRLAFLLHRQHNPLGGNPFFSNVLHGVEEICREQGIVPTYLTLGPTDPIADQVLLHNPEVLLLAGFFEPEVVAALTALEKPMALVDLWAPGFSTINPDNLDGGYRITQHLIEQGCRRIAFLSGSLAHHSIRLREKGYRQALYDAQILGDPELESVVPPGMEGAAGVETATRQLLDLPNPPDAIFAYNDNAALTVLRICQERGLHVPNDIAIAGFDDIEAVRHASPPITSVHVDKEALGRAGVEILLEDHATPVNVLAPVELVVRGSTLRKKSSDS